MSSPHSADMPLFIAIEGIDGSGTTTQTDILVSSLIQSDRLAHGTCEPSQGPIGKLLRSQLGSAGGAVNNTAMALLFAADRADHLSREIVPMLEANKIVVTDRYLASSMAYQGIDDDADWIQMINARVRVPDLIVFIHIDAEVAQARRKSRGLPDDIYDAVDLQARICGAYRNISKKLSSWTRVLDIDGDQPKEDVADEIWTEVTTILQS